MAETTINSLEDLGAPWTEVVEAPGRTRERIAAVSFRKRQVRKVDVTANFGWGTPAYGSALVMSRDQ